MPEINLRVGPDRIFIPDVTVIDAAVDVNELVADAADVRLVAGIGSPSTLLVDRLIKPRAYADAGIPTMLRVESPGTGRSGSSRRSTGPTTGWCSARSRARSSTSSSRSSCRWTWRPCWPTVRTDRRRP